MPKNLLLSDSNLCVFVWWVRLYRVRFLSVFYECLLHFCICTCSAQLSMFHMERHSRNMLIIIIIIIIIIIYLGNLKCYHPDINDPDHTYSSTQSPFYTFLTRQIQLNYLPFIKYFGLPNLLVAQFIEMSKAESVFLWYLSKREAHLYCEFTMAFT